MASFIFVPLSVEPAAFLTILLGVASFAVSVIVIVFFFILCTNVEKILKETKETNRLLSNLLSQTKKED